MPRVLFKDRGRVDLERASPAYTLIKFHKIIPALKEMFMPHDDKDDLEPEDEHSVKGIPLDAIDPETQKDTMRDWFYQHYSDPIHSSPYDSEEGDYVYVFGGPYDPKHELWKEFGGIVPEEIINELADELTEISFNWTGNPDAQALDEYEFDTDDLSRHGDSFEQALVNVELLLATNCKQELIQPFLRLLYANVITALETYLFDFFYSVLKNDKNVFRKFVQENEDFTKKKIALSEVIAQFENIEKTVKEFLTGIAWHNLPRIKPLYKNILKLEFDENLVPELIIAVAVRHDIVHRNGRSKNDDIEITLDESDLNNLILLARRFVARINEDWIKLTVFGGQEPPF